MAAWLTRGGCALAFSGLLLAANPASAQSFTEFPGVAGGGPQQLSRAADQNFWVTDRGVNAIVQFTTAGATTAFPIPTANSQPGGILAGPDGNLWFTESFGNNIGRLTTQGVFTEFAVPTSGSQPVAIAVGADGNLWFAESAGNAIGQITTAGAITEFPVPTANSAPGAIKLGPDGNLWFTESSGDNIGRITPAGVVTEFPLPAGSLPRDLAPGFDGHLWVLESGTNRITQVATTGAVITEFSLPTANAGPTLLRRGPDGALWFTETAANKLGRITTDGTVTEFTPPSAASVPVGLAPGLNGDLWFVETGTNKLGQLLPISGGVQLFASVLPNSQSVELGTTATAFATILNAGATTAHSCAIAPLAGVPNVFAYQTTDPSTNALTGTLNTPVDIPGGAGQSFLVAFNPNAPFVTETVSFGFYCADANSAPITPNVDTLTLSASATPVPNIVALALSPSGDGILDLTGPTGANAFAVATDNLGSPDTIKVTINPGSVPLPVDLAVCETDPSSGQCLAPPTRNLTITFNAGETPTFGFFATGTGTIAFDPGLNRLVVRFLDGNNVLRGATSVAVRTQ